MRFLTSMYRNAGLHVRLSKQPNHLLWASHDDMKGFTLEEAWSLEHRYETPRAVTNCQYLMS